MDLKSIQKITKGQSFLGDEINEIKPNCYIDTGNIALNCLIGADPYRGIPDNKMIQFAGIESTGKTYISQEIVKNAQKQGFDIIYYDTEGAQDANALRNRGIDLEKILIIPIGTVEELTKHMYTVLTEKNPNYKLLIVVDSLGNLSSNKEMTDTLDDKDKVDMTRAKKIRTLFRLISMPCAYKHAPAIFINHTYTTMGTYVPVQTPGGGKGVAYGVSSTILLSKTADRTADKVIVGANIKAKTDKSRLSKEKQDITLSINFSKGINKYAGLFELMEKSEFITKDKRSYIYKDLKFKKPTPAIYDRILDEGFADWLKNEFAYPTTIKILDDDDSGPINNELDQDIEDIEDIGDDE
jgi:RecA/RadA recombinase